MFLCFENCKAWGRVNVDQHGNALLFMEIFWCLKYFVCRREEKLYVEGMEDEDMKKETQNLAYPPAFKLGKLLHTGSEENIPNWTNSQKRKFYCVTSSAKEKLEVSVLYCHCNRIVPKVFQFREYFAILRYFLFKACRYRGGAVCQEAQSVRRGQDLQRGEEEDLRLDAADPEAGGADSEGSHEEDDGAGAQEQRHRPGAVQLVLREAGPITTLSLPDDRLC